MILTPQKGSDSMSETAHSSPETITIIANGQTREIRAGSSIADFLQEFTIAPSRVVAQLDGEIVPRDEFDKAILREGSKLEIVTLVGGG
jgi:thiamine biosynthesis protein ThiS